MKKEIFLENLKSEYRKTEATAHLKESGWDEIAKKIGTTPPFYKRLFSLTLMRASLAAFIFLILFTGVYSLALVSLPGELFYPVKILSEKVAKTVWGNNQVAMDHRAEEIITLLQKDKLNTQELKKVVIEYKTIVEKEQKTVQTSEKRREEFEKKLDDHHSKFDEIGRENPDIQKEIGDATHISEREGESKDGD